MSSSIEHYDLELDADSLPGAIHQALAGRARVPRPLFPMAGELWVLELLDKVAGTALADVARHALHEAARDADPSQREALSAVLAARPDLLDSPDVYANFARTVTDDPAAAVALARTVTAQILAGDTPYSPLLRRHAVDPSLRGALAGAYVMKDHAWYLSEVGAWLEGSFEDVLALLAGSCAGLTLGELNALRTELAGLELSDSAAELVGAYFDEVAEQPSFAERGDAIRWR